MAEHRMTLVDRQRIARDTMAFWFDATDTGFAFRPGQHADFIFAYPDTAGRREGSRTFSIASSPLDKGSIMIAMRMRKTEFKTELMAAALGTAFVVSRPRGSFSLHTDIRRPAVFLAGGIGITPVRSILRWATEKRLPHKLYLFYSNRDLDDAAFMEEFDDMTAQNSDFTLIPTITGRRTLAWPHEKGHIDREMLARHIHGLKGPVYYIAGPSGMVTAMSEMLNASSVNDDDINMEEFGDYKS
jgi:ferredoxin-NADP reductase